MDSMIIESHGIPIPYQIGATFSSWILLAGFILLPGTFTSLGNISKESIPGEIKAFILNVPLLYLSGACCLIGLVGIGFLWHRFQRNYIWVTSYLIRPCFLNSLSGLLTVLVGVYASHGGAWSITAKVIFCVTSIWLACTATALAVYELWFIRHAGRDEAQRGEPLWICNEATVCICDNGIVVISEDGVSPHVGEIEQELDALPYSTLSFLQLGDATTDILVDLLAFPRCKEVVAHLHSILPDQVKTLSYADLLGKCVAEQVKATESLSRGEDIHSLAGWQRDLGSISDQLRRISQSGHIYDHE